RSSRVTRCRSWNAPLNQPETVPLAHDTRMTTSHMRAARNWTARNGRQYTKMRSCHNPVTKRRQGFEDRSSTHIREPAMTAHQGAEHHRAAAEHHAKAAHHHREAAKHHDDEDHTQAAHHAHSAHGHASHAAHHASEASKHHAEHHGDLDDEE